MLLIKGKIEKLLSRVRKLGSKKANIDNDLITKIFLNYCIIFSLYDTKSVKALIDYKQNLKKICFILENIRTEVGQELLLLKFKKSQYAKYLSDSDSDIINGIGEKFSKYRGSELEGQLRESFRKINSHSKDNDGEWWFEPELVACTPEFKFIINESKRGEEGLTEEQILLILGHRYCNDSLVNADLEGMGVTLFFTEQCTQEQKETITNKLLQLENTARIRNFLRKEFLYGLTKKTDHVFKGFLNEVYPLVEYIKDKSKTNPDIPDIYEMSNSIYNSFEIMEEYIQSMLEFSKIITKLEYNKQKINLRALFNKTKSIVNMSVSRQKNLKYDFISQIDEITASEYPLWTVFLNAFINTKHAISCDYAREYSIFLKTEKVENDLFLYIIDNGPGLKLTERIKENIFAGKYSFKPNKTQMEIASGTGLSGCRELVIKMGHLLGMKCVLDIFSEGEGSGFTVSIKFEDYFRWIINN